MVTIVGVGSLAMTEGAQAALADRAHLVFRFVCAAGMVHGLRPLRSPHHRLTHLLPDGSCLHAVIPDITREDITREHLSLNIY